MTGGKRVKGKLKKKRLQQCAAVWGREGIKQREWGWEEWGTEGGQTRQKRKNGQSIEGMRKNMSFVC